MEFRVIWQREGAAKRRVLYQTLNGALECIKRQESASAEMTWLDPPLPKLVYGPLLQSRITEEWEELLERSPK